MTPTPAEYEIKRRPVWDPAPGTACLWHCITHKPLAMHRLSDRVLGGLYIAIDCGLIRKSNCDINESDVGESFKIRVVRPDVNLGHGLLTPDWKAVVSISVHRQSGTFIFELRGAGKTNAKLPAIVYNTDVFKARYPNWGEWLDELPYCQGPDGTIHVEEFNDYSRDDIDGTPPDWPQGLTRDRTLASEEHYRLNNLDLKTGFPKEVRRASSQTQCIPSTPLNSAVSGAEDRKRKRSSITSGTLDVLPDSEDEDSSANPNKKQENNVVDSVPSESLDLPGFPTPVTAPIEVHKAAIRAAFQDKSVNHTELFWTLLPFITLAEAEEILIRCKGLAEAKHE
ncbi:hypothetical protein V492_06887 [Pseudogymnoascus sp. VKM F-4246]|nr:hypothetical protein V492_06887 [Pseudogymnoascus sp. VKM F-4246]